MDSIVFFDSSTIKNFFNPKGRQKKPYILESAEKCLFRIFCKAYSRGKWSKGLTYIIKLIVARRQIPISAQFEFGMLRNVNVTSDRYDLILPFFIIHWCHQLDFDGL